MGLPRIYKRNIYVIDCKMARIKTVQDYCNLLAIIQNNHPNATIVGKGYDHLNRLDWIKIKLK